MQSYKLYNYDPVSTKYTIFICLFISDSVDLWGAQVGGDLAIKALICEADSRQAGVVTDRWKAYDGKFDMIQMVDTWISICCEWQFRSAQLSIK